ncbi:MAG: hypothetical protein JSS86_12445 [Cyanobacteria bacterium SZAS LIN-2]|nr:hypothetical protein [Cyanobacteria bacterium SZAS LIN-3]MBS1997120.1 hypothetical protein [Cyanobacteria bacterium SZAS LIN-2]
MSVELMRWTIVSPCRRLVVYGVDQGVLIMSIDQRPAYVVVETDYLKSRMALVSLDEHPLSARRESMEQLHELITPALMDGSEHVSVPAVLLQELNAAYILFF